MRGFVANLDFEIFSNLASLEPRPEEINFWRPGADTGFRALRSGEPLFFKLKVPHNAIAGFGFFATYSSLPLSLAWEIFGPANGARTREEMRELVVALRSRLDKKSDPRSDFRIGCVLVNHPTFFGQSEWVSIPSDWSPKIVQGKRYDLASGEGERIWLECLARSKNPLLQNLTGEDVTGRSPSWERLGPKSFRVAVVDAYGRRCAVTGEGTLLSLDAACIRRSPGLPQHSLNNGIAFRADIAPLFEAGYVTVTPEYRFLVSRRLHEEFGDGRAYEKLNGKRLILPDKASHQPLVEALWWHREKRFLG